MADTRKSNCRICVIPAGRGRTCRLPVLLVPLTLVMARLLLVVVALAFAVPAPAHADPKQVKPDREAIGALLDAFVPAVVEQKDLKAGWNLVAGVARTTSYREWLKGNTSVQRYPAKGTRFHGFTVNYSYPGDIGFDILLQPQQESLGAWAFRAEAQKLGGRWRITTWYPVATFAPPGKTQTVLGPNDLGPANRSGAAAGSSRLPSWVLLLPLLGLGAVALGAIGFAGTRWAKQRSRIRAIQRSLAR